MANLVYNKGLEELFKADTDLVTADMRVMLDEARLEMPARSAFLSTGKRGVHSEHMGFILAEMNREVFGSIQLPTVTLGPGETREVHVRAAIATPQTLRLVAAWTYSR